MFHRRVHTRDNLQAVQGMWVEERFKFVIIRKGSTLLYPFSCGNELQNGVEAYCAQILITLMFILIDYGRYFGHK